jgi:Zn ribbon nucleic-acid-binding protein
MPETKLLASQPVGEWNCPKCKTLTGVTVSRYIRRIPVAKCIQCGQEFFRGHPIADLENHDTETETN